jgi:hypothetical protein
LPPFDAVRDFRSFTLPRSSTAPIAPRRALRRVRR